MLDKDAVTHAHDIEIDHTVYRGQISMSLHHTHSDFELTYVIRGRRTLYLYEQGCTFDAEHIVFIPNNVPHITISSSQTGQERLNLLINPSFFRELIGEEANLLFSILRSMPLVLAIDTNDKPALLKEINTLISIFHSQEKIAMKDLKIKAAFLNLFMILFKQIEQRYSDLSVVDRRVFMKRDETNRQIIAYLTDNFRQHLSLSHLSDHFHLSKGYLSTSLNQYLGISWIDYVNGLRIKEAIVLLRGLRGNISEIAYSVGFESVTHFDRVFKSLMHQTPTQFIRSLKNQAKKAL